MGPRGSCSLGEKRERWIKAQNFATEQEAERARQAFNQGVIEGLCHEAQLRLQQGRRPSPSRLAAELITRPVPLLTREGA